MAPPAGVPEVVWRAGLDLNPLDVTDPADVAWLDALIWPEHDAPPRPAAGRGRRRAADPPLLVRGDVVDDLPALAAQAPAGATLVVFHTSVMYQVPAPRRQRSPRWCAGCPGTGSRTRPRTCCLRALPETADGCAATTCSRWTGHRSPGRRPHGQAIIWFR